jgi:signal transduction histidine kinase
VKWAERADGLRRGAREALVTQTPSPRLGGRFGERLLGGHAGGRRLRDALPWIAAFCFFWISLASLSGTVDLPAAAMVVVCLGIALPLGMLGHYALLGWRLATAIGVLFALAHATGAFVASHPNPAPWPVTLSFIWLATVLAASARHNRVTVIWIWVTTVAVLTTGLGEQSNFVWIVAVTLAALFGDLLRTRRMTGVELQRQTELSAVEKARRAALEERTRIARDLHDVVAHHMSMVVVQAESAPYRLTGLTEETRAEFASISGSAREALTEIRGLLGVLRQDDRADTAPQPGLADVEELVDNAVRAGVPVTLSKHGDDVPASTAVGLSAYRILQESLANAARHAPGAQVRVELRYDAAAVHLDVRNASSPDARAPGPPGHGIAGMRERAAVVGGTLIAGPDTDGGFAVAATLPLAVKAERLSATP